MEDALRIPKNRRQNSQSYGTTNPTKIFAWPFDEVRRHYNGVRPHSALGYRPPAPGRGQGNDGVFHEPSGRPQGRGPEVRVLTLLEGRARLQEVGVRRGEDQETERRLLRKRPVAGGVASGPPRSRFSGISTPIANYETVLPSISRWEGWKPQE